VFVCTVQTSTGKSTGVIGLVMGADLRDYQHLCFRGRTGVRGSAGGVLGGTPRPFVWGGDPVWGGGGGGGANGCSANGCSGGATARVMAVVVTIVRHTFADLFGGCVGFPPPSSLA
jgi:hypothetical protein